MDTIMRPFDFVLTNVVAVLPDRLVPDATIVVRDGVIHDVIGGIDPPGNAIDGGGAYCMPGAVDTHSDGLEKELRPRPGVVLPMEFALRSFEGRVRAAGVTTVFHGIGFENGAKYDRSVEQALAMCDVVERRAVSGRAPVDHRILYRLDIRDADGFEALRSHVDGALVGCRRVDGSPPPLVSYEDHTPGVGQYTDRSRFERYVAGTRGLDDDAAKRYIDDVVEERDAQLSNRDAAMPWLADRARSGAITLMCHDPAEVADVDEAIISGVTISEFPTTIGAAHASREGGLRIVCGAPNALRGESHSGNVSARDLVRAEVCDSLASDYLPSTLLGAVGQLVEGGVCDLPRAVALITSGPAATVGLFDRGRLEPGYRADLVVFELHGALPTVRLAVSQSAMVETTTATEMRERSAV